MLRRTDWFTGTIWNTSISMVGVYRRFIMTR